VIDAVREALTAVRSSSPPQHGDLAVVELRDRGDVLLGVDDHRRPHLLLRLGPTEPSPTASDVATLAISERNLAFGGPPERFLDVTCLFESVADVFEHFVSAIAERLEGSRSSTDALFAVLEKWRAFLIPAQGPPGRAKLAAVLGELLVLRDVVESNHATALDSWQAPFGGRHDFRRGSTAIEVKTTRAHTSREVTIHGEDQLEAPYPGSLHLHFVRLEEVPGGGQTVSAIVDELLSAGVVADKLFAALGAVGIPAAELAATEDVGFEVRERLTFTIDEETPRIVSTSFAAGARPNGVLDLNYVISLDHLIGRALSVSSYEDLIRTLSAA
jgi:hypothetical protein